MKLELQDVGEEVARVRRVVGHVILRAGIEKLLAARRRRRDALVLEPQLPPRLVVVLGLDLAREDLPPPLVDEQPEREERDLLERLVHQQAEIARRIRRLVEQADPHEILRRHRQRDRVADRLVEAVVGAVAEDRRLILVRALIEVVPEPVVNRREILGRLLDAHLDAEVVDVIDVPRARMAHDLAILRADEE